MQKVFLRLRLNQQAGPFTLDELLQEGLKPTDLIWVEGQSAAWRYPAEIAALKPYLEPAATSEIKPEGQQRTQARAADAAKGQKHIFVRLPQQSGTTPPPTPVPAPADALEQKAEALRQKLQAYTPPAASTTENVYNNSYRPTSEQAAADYSNRALQHRKQRRRTRQLQYGFFIVIMVAAGSFYFISRKSDIPPGTGQPQMQVKEQSTPVHQPLVEEPVMQDSDDDVAVNAPAEKPRTHLTGANLPAAKKPPQEAGMPLPDSGMEKAPAEELAITNPVEAADSSREEPIVAQVPAKEKKRTVGEAIDRFLGQFKGKKEDKKGADTRTPGERKRSKRDEETVVLPDSEQLVPQLKLTANEPATDWMLGIKGMQLTLQNKSAYKIKDAVVEVSYFNEQNTLVEKKTITFQNIAAKGSATRAVPDHKLATHTRQVVLRAAVDEAAYANK